MPEQPLPDVLHEQIELAVFQVQTAVYQSSADR